MSCNKWMRELRRAHRHAKRLRALEEERQRADGVRAAAFDTPSVSGGSWQANSLDRFMEKSLAATPAQRAHAALKVKIEPVICAIEDPLHFEVLYLIYLDGYMLGEVAKITNYSQRQMTRIHSSALASYKEKYVEIHKDGR